MADSPKEEKRLNYFSETERVKQERFANFRTGLVKPWADSLKRIGVKPDHITIVGTLVLIPYAWFFDKIPILSAHLIWVCVLFDAIDGAYARATCTSTPGGSLTDAVSDHLALLVTILLLIFHDFVNPVLGAYYGMIYMVMICFLMVQSYAGIPIQNVFRTKYLLFGAIAFWAFWEINLFQWIMAIASITMTLNTAQSFFRVRKYLDQHGPV